MFLRKRQKRTRLSRCTLHLACNHCDRPYDDHFGHHIVENNLPSPAHVHDSPFGPFDQNDVRHFPAFSHRISHRAYHHKTSACLCTVALYRSLAQNLSVSLGPVPSPDRALSWVNHPGKLLSSLLASSCHFLEIYHSFHLPKRRRRDNGV